MLQPFLGLEGQHDRGRQPAGHREHVVAGLPGTDSDEHGDLRGLVDQVRDGRQGRLIRLARRVRSDPRDCLGVGCLHRADVAGQRQHGDAAFVDRRLDGLVQHRGKLLGRTDGPAEHGDIGEQDVVVDLLEVLAAEIGQRDLPTDRQHRRVRLLGVVQAVQEVDRPRPDGAHADADRAGQLGLSPGRERGDLLVPHADPADAILPPDGVGDGVERVPDDAPDGRDAVVGEGLDELFGDGGHRDVPSEGRRWVCPAIRSGTVPGRTQAQTLVVAPRHGRMTA